MKKRALCLLILPILLFCLSIFLYLNISSPSSFDKFCQEVVSSRLSKDSLGLHFTYKNPERAGITAKGVQLPFYSKKNKQAEYNRIEKELQELQKLKQTSLSSGQQETLTLLQSCLESELQGREYFYFKGSFSPSSGVQIEFPLLMAEYPFYNREDVTQYLKLLSLYPAYMSSQLRLEKERVEKGYGLPDYTIEKLIAQCDDFTTPLYQNPDSHFLVSEFSKKLLVLLEGEAITEEEYQKLVAKNYEILKNELAPTYANIRTVFAEFLGRGKNAEGLCHYRQGKDYYQYLFRNTTGSSENIDTVYRTLSENYYNLTSDLQKDYQYFLKNNTLSQAELSYFPLETPEEMLTHLHSQMRRDFPPLNINLSPAKQVKIKQVADNLKKYTAPAYYFIPPLDYTFVNSIYINPGADLKGISLYTTLAHEGFPGHLYQTNFFSSYRKKQNIPDIRGILSYNGYVEGWALYTEFLSYDYAVNLLVSSTGKKDYVNLYQLYREDKQSSLALLSLLDIAIHYYGIDYERTCELLSAHGITDSSVQKEIYEYIIEEPCNYLKYYWGYFEIMKLKAEAVKSMGDLYTDYGFHKFLLEEGPSDFDYLRQKLKRKHDFSRYTVRD